MVRAATDSMNKQKNNNKINKIPSPDLLNIMSYLHCQEIWNPTKYRQFDVRRDSDEVRHLKSFVIYNYKSFYP